MSTWNRLNTLPWELSVSKSAFCWIFADFYFIFLGGLDVDFGYIYGAVDRNAVPFHQ